MQSGFSRIPAFAVNGSFGLSAPERPVNTVTGGGPILFQRSSGDAGIRYHVPAAADYFIYMVSPV